jgi:hypothetical protein
VRCCRRLARSATALPTRGEPVEPSAPRGALFENPQIKAALSLRGKNHRLSGLYTRALQAGNFFVVLPDSLNLKPRTRITHYGENSCYNVTLKSWFIASSFYPYLYHYHNRNRNRFQQLKNLCDITNQA